ncbi:MAG: hypothetical protein ACOX3T_06465 [Bdellovibrionota bacterium]
MDNVKQTSMTDSIKNNTNKLSLDDIKLLNVLYNFSVNSIVKYVVNAGIYYESEAEKRAAKRFFRPLLKSFENISSAVEDICIKNRVSLTLGTFDVKYLDLSYLSYKFIKDYVEKELDYQRETLHNLAETLNVSKAVENLAKSF